MLEVDLVHQKSLFKKKTEICTLQMQKKGAMQLDHDENIKTILDDHERSQAHMREVIDSKKKENEQLIREKKLLKKCVRGKQEQMTEVLQSNQKYEHIINKMKFVFVDNPLYDFLVEKDNQQKGRR